MTESSRTLPNQFSSLLAVASDRLTTALHHLLPHRRSTLAQVTTTADNSWILARIAAYQQEA